MQKQSVTLRQVGMFRNSAAQFRNEVKGVGCRAGLIGRRNSTLALLSTAVPPSYYATNFVGKFHRTAILKHNRSAYKASA